MSSKFRSQFTITTKHKQLILRLFRQRAVIVSCSLAFLLAWLLYSKDTSLNVETQPDVSRVNMFNAIVYRNQFEALKYGIVPACLDDTCSAEDSTSLESSLTKYFWRIKTIIVHDLHPDLVLQFLATALNSWEAKMLLSGISSDARYGFNILVNLAEFWTRSRIFAGPQDHTTRIGFRAYHTSNFTAVQKIVR